MKILHTSDWHLGACDRDKSLIEDQEYFIDRICDIAYKENVDVVIIAGDVFDRAITSAEAIKLYDDAMTRLCLDMRKEVIIVAGNHDSAERLSSCNSLLDKAGLHVVGAITEEPNIVSIKDVDFYLLPWFTEEKVKSLYPDRSDDIKSLSDAYMVVCDKMRDTFLPNKKHVAISHSFITNAEVSESDRAARIGFATQVGGNVFEGFDYVALGHIHKPQDIGDNIRYSGTPMPYSFGNEEKQTKSVTILDSEDFSVSARTIVPLPLLHTRLTLSGTFEQIINNDYSEDIQNGYLNIEVTDIYVDSSAYTKLILRFPNARIISGKSFEDGDSSINMSVEEFRKLETDPLEIFDRFYVDTMGESPDDHLKDIFRECMERVGGLN